MKTLRAHHPTPGLRTVADQRLRGQLTSRGGGSRHQHRPAPESVAPAAPALWRQGRTRLAEALPFPLSGFIFDLEGTLIDTVLPTLQCWSETLAQMGFAASVADLHAFSGKDDKQMLRRLIKKHDPKLIEHILTLQEERYRERYLPHIRPFPGVRHLFAAIKNNDAKIALATSCDRDELAHYRGLINVDDLLDIACCSEDVRGERAHPEIISLAVRRLRLPPSDIVMVGDTPYDAQAGRAAGLGAIGVQSGHFSRSDLLDAGCAAVFFDLQAFGRKLDEWANEKVAESRSHIGAMADSH